MQTDKSNWCLCLGLLSVFYVRCFLLYLSWCICISSLCLPWRNKKDIWTVRMKVKEEIWCNKIRTFLSQLAVGILRQKGKQREGGIVLFNDALNTFYLRLYGIRHMVRDIHIVRQETRCHHMGYSFWLAARGLSYAPSHRQGSTYHGLCYTNHGALAGMRNSSMGPSWRIDPMTHRNISKCSYHGATSRSGKQRKEMQLVQRSG